MQHVREPAAGGLGVDARHDRVVVVVQPRGLEDAEPAPGTVLDAALTLVLQQQRVRDREDPGAPRRHPQPPKAAHGLERPGECLGGQVERDVGVAAVERQRAIHRARVPAIEDAERIRVYACTAQQLAVVKAWGVHAPTRMHNSTGM